MFDRVPRAPDLPSHHVERIRAASGAGRRRPVRDDPEQLRDLNERTSEWRAWLRRQPQSADRYEQGEPLESRNMLVDPAVDRHIGGSGERAFGPAARRRLGMKRVFEQESTRSWSRAEEPIAP